MNMVSDVFNKFSMKREVTDETEDDGDIVLATNGRTEGYLDALAAKLRGTTEDLGRRSSWYAWYYYWYYSRSSITCNYVSSLDDAVCLFFLCFFVPLTHRNSLLRLPTRFPLDVIAVW